MNILSTAAAALSPADNSKAGEFSVSKPAIVQSQKPDHVVEKEDLLPQQGTLVDSNIESSGHPSIQPAHSAAAQLSTKSAAAEQTKVVEGDEMVPPSALTRSDGSPVDGSTGKLPAKETMVGKNGILGHSQYSSTVTPHHGGSQTVPSLHGAYQLTGNLVQQSTPPMHQVNQTVQQSHQENQTAQSPQQEQQNKTANPVHALNGSSATSVDNHPQTTMLGNHATVSSLLQLNSAMSKPPTPGAVSSSAVPTPVPSPPLNQFGQPIGLMMNNTLNHGHVPTGTIYNFNTINSNAERIAATFAVAREQLSRQAMQFAQQVFMQCKANNLDDATALQQSQAMYQQQLLQGESGLRVQEAMAHQQLQIQMQHAAAQMDHFASLAQNPHTHAQFALQQNYAQQMHEAQRLAQLHQAQSTSVSTHNTHSAANRTEVPDVKQNITKPTTSGGEYSSPSTHSTSNPSPSSLLPNTTDGAVADPDDTARVIVAKTQGGKKRLAHVEPVTQAPNKKTETQQNSHVNNLNDSKSKKRLKVTDPSLEMKPKSLETTSQPTPSTGNSETSTANKVMVKNEKKKVTTKRRGLKVASSNTSIDSNKSGRAEKRDPDKIVAVDSSNTSTEQPEKQTKSVPSTVETSIPRGRKRPIVSTALRTKSINLSDFRRRSPRQLAPSKAEELVKVDLSPEEQNQGPPKGSVKPEFGGWEADLVNSRIEVGQTDGTWKLGVLKNFDESSCVFLVRYSDNSTERLWLRFDGTADSLQGNGKLLWKQSVDTGRRSRASKGGSSSTATQRRKSRSTTSGKSANTLKQGEKSDQVDANSPSSTPKPSDIASSVQHTSTEPTDEDISNSVLTVDGAAIKSTMSKTRKSAETTDTSTKVSKSKVAPSESKTNSISATKYHENEISSSAVHKHDSVALESVASPPKLDRTESGRYDKKNVKLGGTKGKQSSKNPAEVARGEGNNTTNAVNRTKKPVKPRNSLSPLPVAIRWSSRRSAPVVRFDAGTDPSVTVPYGRGRKRDTKSSRKNSVSPTVDENFKPPKKENAVNWNVQVWWPQDKLFYHGTVTEYDEDKDRHLVTYDDDEVETLNLSRQRVQWHLKDEGKWLLVEPKR